jgi:phosphoribosyl 1,2-cyclic phosphodiesterase
MRIKFWGTRGSIPTPITNDVVKNKIRQALLGAAGLDLAHADVLTHYLERLSPVISGTVGGDTPCIEVQSGDQVLILDAGSGLRRLGLDLLARGVPKQNTQLDFLMTHTHWDHIQGFPFFEFAFQPENQLTFYSAVSDLASRFSCLTNSDWSPGFVGQPQAKFDFVHLPSEKTFTLKNLQITPVELSHPGQSFGYRIEDDHSSFIYATDAAYETLETKYVDFYKGADLLVFDSHFSFAESIDKVDWGHSTAMFGAEFAYRAQIKRLALFHHNPTDNDEQIHLAMQQAQAYLTHRTFVTHPCQVLIAKDGLELEI